MKLITAKAKAKTKAYEPYALAKPFLTQVRRQNEEIQSRIFSLKAVQAMAGLVTCTLSMTPVIHSKNPSAMDESVARIMEAEDDLADALADLLDITDEITGVLRQIEDPDCRKVMELLYLSLEKPSEIAVDMRCSRRWVTELHSKGLRFVQRLLEDKEAA